MENEKQYAAIYVDGIPIKIKTDCNENYLQRVSELANEFYNTFYTGAYKNKENIAAYFIEIADKYCELEFKHDEAWDKINTLKYKLKNADIGKSVSAAENKALKQAELLNKKLSEYRNKINQLTDERDKLQKNAAESAAEINRLQKTVEESEAEKNALQAENKKLKRKTTETEPAPNKLKNSVFERETVLLKEIDSYKRKLSDLSMSNKDLTEANEVLNKKIRSFEEGTQNARATSQIFIKRSKGLEAENEALKKELEELKKSLSDKINEDRPNISEKKKAAVKSSLFLKAESPKPPTLKGSGDDIKRELSLVNASYLSDTLLQNDSFSPVNARCIMGSDFVEIVDEAPYFYYMVKAEEEEIFRLYPSKTGIDNYDYIAAIFDTSHGGSPGARTKKPAEIIKKAFGYELLNKGIVVVI
ncbi:MAG: hypothetical protein LUC97_09785 [Clostridiales bacterium]|nr:hypothetical protein [Clostridiales bacterium]